MDQRLSSLLAEVFGVPRAQIVPHLTKDDVGSWDSLKQMDLVMSLENEFDVQLEIADIITMTSVEKIIRVLRSKGVELAA
jgi:acyl carrier protein